MRSLAKARAAMHAANPRPPRKREGGGGQRGGWNAGPYIGTARVQEHGSCIRVIAIRARKDGRLYGYAGRTQVCWSSNFSAFPCVMSGVKVLDYVHGGTL